MDVLDTERDEYLRSIPGLPGVAGALVSNEKDLVFTSNRGEKTVSVFPHGHEDRREKVNVGGRPNGLAFDPKRNHLLAANVAKLGDPDPITVSIVDPSTRNLLADVQVPGRTRWTVYDERTDTFYVNISKPPQIAAVDGNTLSVRSKYEIPAVGPHGLDIDPERRRLFCACDQGGLYTVELDSGRVNKASDLAGGPDVIFYNSRLKHLYVTEEDPGVIEVFDTNSMKLVQTVKTELGAGTIGYDKERDKVYSFMPETHRAAVYVDS